MEAILQDIIIAYDAWVIANRAAAQADIALKAMSAYILSEEKRIKMYHERKDALAEASRKQQDARVELNRAIEKAREGLTT